MNNNQEKRSAEETPEKKLKKLKCYSEGDEEMNEKNKLVDTILSYLGFSENHDYLSIDEKWAEVKKITSIGMVSNKDEVPLKTGYDICDSSKVDKKFRNFNCSSKSHRASIWIKIHSESVTEDILLKILKIVPNIEALVLYGLTLNDEIISAIEESKKLKCIHLNEITLTEEIVYDKLRFNTLPRIVHLSIDNCMIIQNLGYIFNRKDDNFFFHPYKLKELVLNIKPINSNWDFISLQELGPKLCSVFINDLVSEYEEEEDNDSNEPNLLKILRNLKVGNAQHIEYLSLYSKENNVNLLKVISILKGFPYLKALKINFMNYGPEEFKALTKLNDLLSLTINFYTDRNYINNDNIEKQILEMLSTSKFQNKIKRLQLIDGELQENDLKMIAHSFSNLDCLQLINIRFQNDDIEMAFNIFLKIVKLNYLRIEFDLADETLKKFKSYYQIPELSIKLIHKALECQHFKKIVIYRWPGLQESDLQKCQRIAETHGKKFKYKVFEV